MLKITVPATLANLGPGFDSFGMAVDILNTFDIELNPDGEDVIALGGAAEQSIVPIPKAPADNLVIQAMDALYRDAKAVRPPIRLTVTPEVPLARGMGSSSTAIAAGLMAANRLLNDAYSLSMLCRMATALEGHPDNVVPALQGGVWLCDEAAFYPLPWPSDWRILLVIPPYPILTEEARSVMPKQVALEDAVLNVRKASMLTYGLLKADPAVFANALDDRLHQPYRGQLIKEFLPLQDLARQQGALGTIISGSGSTLAVFAPADKFDTLCEQVKATFSHCLLKTPQVATHGAIVR